MRPRTCFLTATSIAVALSGCFTTTADYREQAETFIVDDDAVATELGVSFVSATCEEPADQEVGTVFGCTAVDETSATWDFDVEIGGSERIDVTVSQRP